MKILQSGLKVPSDEYYKLLEWKDNNFEKFDYFVISRIFKTPNVYHWSINSYNQEDYNALLKFADL